MKVIDNIIKFERCGGLAIVNSGPYLKESDGLMSMAADITLRETIHQEFSLLTWLNKISREELKKHDGKYVRVTVIIDEILRDGYYVESEDYSTGDIRFLYLCEIGKEDHLKLMAKKLVKNKKFKFYKITEGKRIDIDIAAFLKPERKETKDGNGRRGNKTNKKSQTGRRKSTS